MSIPQNFSTNELPKLPSRRDLRKKNKRPLIIGIVIALVVILAGVAALLLLQPKTDDVYDPNSGEPTIEHSFSDPASPEEQAAFVKEIRVSHEEFFEGKEDDSIITAGELICESLDDGKDFNHVVENILASGFDEDEASAFVTQSIESLCAEHAG